MYPALSKIWRNRIEAGTQFYAKCPQFLKKEVYQLLKDDVANGTITAAEFKTFTGEDYVPDAATASETPATA